jgi:perosamine synthetase
MTFIPQMEPWFDAEEAEALSSYVLSGGWGTEFRQTQEFEQRLCEFTGARHCIATTSGTAALSIALMAVGMGVGDEVIVPDMTMIASPNSARMIGAVPVFADVEPATLNIDIASVESLITSRTKAVMHVSLNGRSNDILALRELCQRRGIALIEDSCQSLGSFHGDQHLGTMGDIGVLSFSPPKIITTGQGGALLTNDDDLALGIKKLKDFGRASGGHDVHDQIGFNFKFTDFQGTVGNEQMKKLPSRIARKKEIWRRYQEQLLGLQEINWLDTDLDLVSPWFIDIYTERRDELAAHLKENEIGSRVVYPPIHSQVAYGQEDQAFPVTESFASRGLWLPSAAQLTNDQIDRICDVIRSFFKG